MLLSISILNNHQLIFKNSGINRRNIFSNLLSFELLYGYKRVDFR